MTALILGLGIGAVLGLLFGYRCGLDARDVAPTPPPARSGARARCARLAPWPSTVAHRPARPIWPSRLPTRGDIPPIPVLARTAALVSAVARRPT